jgi:amino acid transporter
MLKWSPYLQLLLKQQEGPMKNKLTLTSMTLLGINNIVGSGIFLLPGEITALIGGWSLASYLFIMAVVLALAYCYSGCASRFEQNGGAYLYAKTAFGDFVGFQVGVMRWTVGAIAWASLASAFGSAASAFFPGGIEPATQNILILSVIALMGLLNFFDLKMMSIFSNTITLAKLIPLLLFIVVGVFYIQQDHLTELDIPEWNSGAFGVASLMVFYVFGGFDAFVVAAGEMENPKRNIPIAMTLAIVITALFYLSIQLIGIGTLGPDLASSAMPMSDFAFLAFGPSGKLFVTLSMILCILGVNFSSSLLTPKYGVALAEDGMMPEAIGRKNRFGAPYVAILISMAAAASISLMGSFVYLAALSAVSRFAQHIVICLASIVINKDRLSLQRIVMPILGLSGVFWLMGQAEMNQLSCCIAAFGLSVPLYFLQKYRLTPEKDGKSDPLPQEVLAE